jgi:hypothetical protein
MLLWLLHCAALVPVDCAKRGVDSLGRVASVKRVAVEYSHRIQNSSSLELECLSSLCISALTRPQQTFLVWQDP